MFVQGVNSDKSGDNLKLVGSGVVEEFPCGEDNNLLDAFVCKSNFQFSNANHENSETKQSDRDIFNVQAENIGDDVSEEGTFLVKDVLEICNPNLKISNTESVQFDAMVQNNPIVPAAHDNISDSKEPVERKIELEEADGKLRYLETIIGEDFQGQLQEKDFVQKSNSVGESFQSEGKLQVLSCLNDSYIMVQTNDGEQVYTVDTSQFLQAVNSEKHVSLGENGGVVLNLMSATEDEVNQAGFLMGNPTEFVVETLSRTEDIKEKTPPKTTSTQIFKCSEKNCDKSFESRQKLKAHSVIHYQQRSFKCPVESCEWSFNTANKLTRHIESHSGQKKFTCDFEGCNRLFTTVYNLRTHKKIHNRPFIVPCTACDEKFPSTRLMEIHYKQHKNVEAPYKCPAESCDKKFFTAFALSSHKRKHQKPESELRCYFEGCDKLFENQSRLRQHIRQHTGERPYVCDFEGCSWAFTTGSKLARHKRKHTGIRKYSCPYEDCDKKFMRKEHLDQHIISHSNARPFVCGYKGCKSRFAAKSSWYVHRRKVHLSRHTNNPVYMCLVNECHEEFTDKELMKVHFQQHFGGSNADNTTIDSGVFALISGNEMSEPDLDRPLIVSTSTSTDVGGSTIVTFSDGNSSCQELYSTTASGQTIHILPIKCDSSELAQAVSTIDSLPSTPVEDTAVQIDVTSLPISSVLDGKSVTGVHKKNHSGCARTDYLYTCSSDRRKNQRASNTANSVDLGEKNSSTEEPLSRKRTFSEIDSNHVSLAMNLAPTDVVLTSGAITFRDPTTGAHFVQTQLLQDDPPCVITDIQSDHLLPSLCSGQMSQPSELTVPVSLFSDNADSPNKAQVSHLFTGMTLSMQDFPNDACLQNVDC